MNVEPRFSGPYRWPLAPGGKYPLCGVYAIWASRGDDVVCVYVGQTCAGVRQRLGVHFGSTSSFREEREALADTGWSFWVSWYEVPGVYEEAMRTRARWRRGSYTFSRLQRDEEERAIRRFRPLCNTVVERLAPRSLADLIAGAA